MASPKTKKKEENINLIYILGTAYSGSTILGHILGTSERIFNAGELSFYNSLDRKKNACSCGTILERCPFWSNIYKNHPKIHQVCIFQKVPILLKTLFGSKIRRGSQKKSKDLNALRSILKEAQKRNKRITYILDTSKSIERLAHLMRCEGIDIKIIYLKREIYGNMSSFKKRKYKQGFWGGLFMYLTYHSLMQRFIKVNNLPHTVLHYEQFCRHTQRELDKTVNNLGIPKFNYKKRMRIRDDHIHAGNSRVMDNIIAKSGSLDLDQSWKNILTTRQKNIIGFFKRRMEKQEKKRGRTR